MAVRNWWIEGNIDGRATNISGGPRSKDGGFDITIYQRDDNGIITAARISGHAYNDKLRLTAVINNETLVLETKR